MRNKSKDQIFLIQGLLATKIVLSLVFSSLSLLSVFLKALLLLSTETISPTQKYNEPFPEPLLVFEVVILSFAFSDGVWPFISEGVKSADS